MEMTKQTETAKQCRQERREYHGPQTLKDTSNTRYIH